MFKQLLAAALLTLLAATSVQAQHAGGGMLPNASNATLPDAVNNILVGGAGLSTLNTASRPTSLGNWDSITTAFTGDLSHMQFGCAHQTTGVSVGTAGAPATGYQITPELTCHSLYGYNSSGNNQQITGNSGRTGVFNTYSATYQHGQGDFHALYCSGFVDSVRAGATTFLASPQSGCIGGQQIAGAAGAYLQGIGDINFTDHGFDSAVVALNFNFNRTNAAGALNTNWGAFNFQNTGTLPIDWMLRATGAVRTGVDLTSLTYPDLTLIQATLSNGGTGYAVGDILVPSDGTSHQVTTLKVLTVNGSGVILTFGLDRAGLYTTAPTITNSVTGGGGTGAVVTLQYTTTTTSSALSSRANHCWYGNATNDAGVFNTTYSSTLKLGTSYICYSSALVGWNFVVGNTSALQISQSSVISPVIIDAKLGIKNNGKLLVSATAPTIASGGCTTGSTQSISANNGSAAFAITLGGGTCGSMIVLTLPAATAGWICDAHDITTPASNVVEQSAGGSTTAVTLTNYARTTGAAGNFTAADVLAVKCSAY